MGRNRDGLVRDDISQRRRSKRAFYGDISLLWKQLIAIAATYLFVAIVTYAIIKIVSIFFKLRASEDEESLGLDLTLHGEKAYQD